MEGGTSQTTTPPSLEMVRDRDCKSRRGINGGTGVECEFYQSLCGDVAEWCCYAILPPCFVTVKC